jgi:hypothetical protein
MLLSFIGFKSFCNKMYERTETIAIPLAEAYFEETRKSLLVFKIYTLMINILPTWLCSCFQMFSELLLCNIKQEYRENFVIS